MQEVEGESSPLAALATLPGLLPSPLGVDRAVLLDGLIECLGSVPQFLYVVCLRCHFMSVLAIDTQSNKTRQLFPTFFAQKTIFLRLGHFP